MAKLKSKEATQIGTQVKLKVRKVRINSDTEHFTDIEELTPIPADCIIDKTLSGLGATYSEIIQPRNSIIVLPNVSTIVNKHDQHQEQYNTFAVYEGIKKQKLEDYLSTHSSPIKILTTPEAFVHKVKPVLLGLSIDLYKDYFLLIDECHKVIGDSGYRRQITLPLDDFFLFDNKAMLSATTLLPSDKRFEEHNFELIKVNPIHDIKEPITLIKTDNVLQKLISMLYEGQAESYFVFFNSINGIKSIIDGMRKLLGEAPIAGQYQIYCSKESATELQRTGITYVSHNYEQPTKYNFFTSSFFNGLDMYYAGKMAEVIIVTDVKYQEHTAIDPLTDTIQIRGRFRPYKENGNMKQWVSSLTHIIRTDRNITYLTQQEAMQRLSYSKDLYGYIENFFTSVPQLNENIAKAVTGDIQSVLSRVQPYANLLNDDQTLNSYLVDNYLFKEQVKGYYAKWLSIVTAYAATKRFELSLIEVDKYPNFVEDMKYGTGRYSPQNYLDVTNMLWELEGGWWDYDYAKVYKQLNDHFPLIVKAYETMDMEIIEALGFQHKYIQQAVKIADGMTGRNKLVVIDAVHAEFNIGQVYKVIEIKQKLQDIFDMFEVPQKADGSEIEIYFEVKPAQQNRQRAFRLLRPKHTNAYQRS